MDRERFLKLVEQAYGSIPVRFRRRIHNVAVLVEDLPPQQQPRSGKPHPTGPQRPKQLLLGVFAGVPRTHKSVFQLPTGPDHIVLYQKNIESVCRNDDEIREQVRRTLIHELGHYFGMDESQLEDV